MTKEELIALSDLNREDNIKYISSEAQGIAIALDSDRYAPTLCKLERAYICGRRKSEKRIENLEKENTALRQDWEIMKKTIADYGDFCDKYMRLEKENAELKRDKEDLIFIRNQNAKCMCEDKEKLTKAKEIIKILLKYDRGQFFDDRRIYEQYIHTRGEAEQFIKDSEVEK